MPRVVAISLVTQMQASGVNGVLDENDAALSLIAEFVSTP